MAVAAAERVANAALQGERAIPERADGACPALRLCSTRTRTAITAAAAAAAPLLPFEPFQPFQGSSTAVCAQAFSVART